MKTCYLADIFLQKNKLGLPLQVNWQYLFREKIWVVKVKLEFWETFSYHLSLVASQYWKTMMRSVEILTTVTFWFPPPGVHIVHNSLPLSVGGTCEYK